MVRTLVSNFDWMKANSPNFVTKVTLVLEIKSSMIYYWIFLANALDRRVSFEF